MLPWAPDVDPDTEEGLLRVRLMLRARGSGAARELVAYREDPVRFAVEVLGLDERGFRWSLVEGMEGHRWDGDVDPPARMLEALAEGKDVAVEAGTGTHKTFTAAVAVLWWLSCWEGAQVITSAPREKQLTLNLWKEIGRLWEAFSMRFPTAKLTTLRIRVDGSDEWAAHGLVSGVGAAEEVATRMQGFHAEHQLFVLEELPGMHPAVVTAVRNTQTGTHNLTLGLGNPDSKGDPLHQMAVRPDVVAVRISALDHPNVVTGVDWFPGAASRKSVESRRLEYGEEHHRFLSRVRGISPDQPVDALIRREWVEEAQRKWRVIDAARRAGEEHPFLGLRALGVDVASSEDGDKGAVAEGWGAFLHRVRVFTCPDETALGVELLEQVEREGVEGRHVGVDTIGVGSGTFNRMLEGGFRAQSLKGSAKPVTTVDWEAVAVAGEKYAEVGTYRNLRSQMWWYLRRDLQRGLVALPPDEDLTEELLAVKWWENDDRVTIEPKAEVRVSLGRSPDAGDAAVYWNWVRPRRVEEEEEEALPVEDYDPGFEELVKRNEERKRRKRAF